MDLTLEEELQEETGSLDSFHIYIKAFNDLEARCTQLAEHKKDYENLCSTLKQLLKKVTHKIIVPLSPLAFVPGELQHTNEITVLLGDNWFSTRSVEQVFPIISRRQKRIQDNIVAMRAQQKNLLSKMNILEDLQNENDPILKDIKNASSHNSKKASSSSSSSSSSVSSVPSEQESNKIANITHSITSKISNNVVKNEKVANENSNLSCADANPFSIESVTASRLELDRLQKLEEKQEQEDDDEEEESADESTLGSQRIEGILAKLNCLREFTSDEKDETVTENIGVTDEEEAKFQQKLLLSSENGVEVCSQPLYSNPSEIYDSLIMNTQQNASSSHLLSSCLASSSSKPASANSSVSLNPKRRVSFGNDFVSSCGLPKSVKCSSDNFSSKEQQIEHKEKKQNVVSSPEVIPFKDYVVERTTTESKNNITDNTSVDTLSVVPPPVEKRKVSLFKQQRMQGNS